MTITAYTDASICPTTRVGTCGFMAYAGVKLKKSVVTIFGGCRKVNYLEMVAISDALQYCFLQKGVERIIIFTDQLYVANKVKKVRKSEIGKEIFEIVEIIQQHGIEVEIKYIKSHKGNLRHNIVDRMCKSQLKKYINERKQKAGSKAA